MRKISSSNIKQPHKIEDENRSLREALAANCEERDQAKLWVHKVTAELSESQDWREKYEQACREYRKLQNNAVYSEKAWREMKSRLVHENSTIQTRWTEQKTKNEELSKQVVAAQRRTFMLIEPPY